VAERKGHGVGQGIRTGIGYENLPRSGLGLFGSPGLDRFFRNGEDMEELDIILDFTTVQEVAKVCRIGFTLAPEVKAEIDDIDEKKMLDDPMYFKDQCVHIADLYMIDSRESVLANREEILRDYGIEVVWILEEEHLGEVVEEGTRIDEFDPGEDDRYLEQLQKQYGK